MSLCSCLCTVKIFLELTVKVPVIFTVMCDCSVLQVSLEETGIFEEVNGSAAVLEVSHVMLLLLHGDLLHHLAYLSVTKVISNCLSSHD